MAKQIRIDNLKPGTIVEFVAQDSFGSKPEIGYFLGVQGEGDDRRATFASPVLNGNLKSARLVEFEVYRFNNRWSFGSSADRFSVTEIVADSPFPL